MNEETFNYLALNRCGKCKYWCNQDKFKNYCSFKKDQTYYDDLCLNYVPNSKTKKYVKHFDNIKKALSLNIIVEFNFASADELYSSYVTLCKKKKQKPLKLIKYIDIVNKKITNVNIDGVFYYLGTESEKPLNLRSRLIKQYKKYSKFQPRTKIETMAAAKELDLELII